MGNEASGPYSIVFKTFSHTTQSKENVWTTI